MLEKVADPRGRTTVLVVDDVPENIATLSACLRDQYRVVFATRGEDALELARTQRIDLILLDVVMPHLDGYEVCRRLKADITTREIPIIFVTGLTEPGDQALGLRLGAVDFLQKPCPPEIVRLRVRLHLERYNQALMLERRVQERTLELEETRLEIVRRLGRAAEYRDNETGMHVVRMSHVSRLLGEAAGVTGTQLRLLFHAAPMHDVGKIGIPDAILLKPAKLNAEEWEVMKTHTVIGAAIIGEHASDLMRMARIMALSHHEKWDGSGYPNGLAAEAIPLEGRIVAIADVFDALTSVRPYKRAWSTSEAVAFMEAQREKAFDPHLLGLFLEMLPQVEAIRAEYSDHAGLPER